MIPFEFTKAKFLSLHLMRQHKKLALLLKSAYLQRVQGGDAEELIALYRPYGREPLNTLKEISDAFHFHARLAGISLREHSLLPNPKTEDAPDKKPPLPLYVYLDHLRSAFNAGSIIRSAEAFGFSKVFFSKDSPNQASTKVQKSAMGAEAWIECVVDPPLQDVPRPWIVLETVPEAPSIFDVQLPHAFTLILGNEEYGVSDALLKEADLFVRIPLRGRKGSLNVANAFAIAAAEASNRFSI